MLGFPPADHSARVFLTSEFTKGDEEPLQRAQAFLIALFNVTLRCLKSIDMHLSKFAEPPPDPKKLNIDALKFRYLMTHGQSFYEPNEFRRKFFVEVVSDANKASVPKSVTLPSSSHLLSSWI